MQATRFTDLIVPLTITQPLKRLPAFAELRSLAERHNVQINGNETAGDFWYPDEKQPRVTGRYAIDTSGNISGDFSAKIMGTTTGTFAITPEIAQVTIAEKPFLLPESLLKTALSTALNDFCTQFSSFILNG